jgi:hypothetical protein
MHTPSIEHSMDNHDDHRSPVLVREEKHPRFDRPRHERSDADTNLPDLGSSFCSFPGTCDVSAYRAIGAAPVVAYPAFGDIERRGVGCGLWGACSVQLAIGGGPPPISHEASANAEDAPMRLNGSTTTFSRLPALV